MKLSFYIQPGAKKTELSGFHDGLMKLRIAAPPVEGAANKAVLAFVSEYVGLPKSSVRLLSGEKSRIKTVELDETKAKHKDKLDFLLAKG